MSNSIAPNTDSVMNQTIVGQNPFNLDYYGINFQRTFQNDEQEYQNHREYLMLKRAVEKKCLYSSLKKEFQSNELAKKFEIPKHLNVDDEIGRLPEVSVKDKSNSVNFIRTEKKKKNAEIAGLELLRRKEEINNLFANNLLKLTPEAKKSDDIDLKTRRNIEALVAQKDFENYVKSKSVLNDCGDDQADERSIAMVKQKYKYPETLKEFNTKLKALKNEKQIAREKAVISNEFFNELGINRQVKNFDIRSDSSDISNSLVLNDQVSRNVEIRVDKSKNPPVETCQTRCDWLKELCRDTKKKQQKKPKERKPEANSLKADVPDKRGLSYFVAHSKRGNSFKLKTFSAQIVPIKNQVKQNTLSKYFLSSESVDNVSSTKSEHSLRLSTACFPRSNQMIFPSLKQKLPLPEFIVPTIDRTPAIKNYYKHCGKTKPQDDTTEKVPLLRRPENDLVVPPNVSVIPKNDANKVFKVRRHHHHHDPVQHQRILVEYDPIRPQDLLSIAEPMNSDTCVDLDHYLDGCSLNRNSSQNFEVSVSDELKPETTSNKEQKSYVDKEQFLNELKTEVSSIKSCVSSLSSSVCTNFTYDSGSLLLVDDKAIPLHYIRKSSVPFENINRCRVEANIFEDSEKKQAPFYRVPFSGQLQEMRRLVNPSDTFHTMATRSRCGLRKRLEIDLLTENVERIMPKHKETQRVDEFERIRRKSFKLKTFRMDYRKFIRQKYTKKLTHLIFEKSIDDSHAIQNIEQCSRLSESYLFNLTEKAYQNYMKSFKELAHCLGNTTKLKDKLKAIKVQYTKVEEKILNTEKLFKENLICQKLHYLLKDDEWRESNDWLHRKEDNSLESIQVAIANKYKKFVRIEAANNDSALDVKAFNENNYLNCPIRSAPIYVFENKKDFLHAINDLAKSILDSELISKNQKLR